MISKRTCIALILIGLIAGIVGFLLTELMHFMQEFTYGFSRQEFHSFIAGVEQASPERRVIALLATGLVGGIGWFLIHRLGSPLVSIAAAVKDPSRPMPTFTTICHALLQIVTVGMGSPLGREVAPREMSAALTNYVTKYVQPDMKERSLLIACAAGAGLAAVYNAPISAAIFTLETLLLAWDRKSILSALLTAGIATAVVRLCLGNTLQYELPDPGFAFSLVPWCLIFAPIVALAVLLFKKSDAYLPKINRKSPWIILISVVAFGIIGLLSIWYPAILGNGKPGNQLTFDHLISAQYALELFASKWVAILLAALAGAYGGRLTPSMMLGSTLALITAVTWNSTIIHLGMDPTFLISVGGAAFVGAALYLGINQNMPITAVIFLIELSRWSIEYALPISLAMGLGLAVYYALKPYVLKEA